MNIIFTKLVFDNFMSYKHAEVNFENYKGFTFIQGINNNIKDNARSNGSGKSSIFEAIAFALTGETIRGIKDVKNLYLDDDAKVELEFIVDNNKYNICRIKGKKTDLKIYINGEDKSGKGIKDSQELLEQYLPDITAELIGSVIILGQGLPQRFSNNSPSGRKQVLEQLSKSDFMIEDLKQRITTRKTELNIDISNNHDEEVTLNTTKSSIESQIASNKNKLDNMEDITNISNKLDNYKQDLNVKNNEKLLITEQKNKLIDERNQLRESFATNKAKRDTLKNKYESDLISLNKDNENKVIILNSEINNLKKEINRIDNIKDICPTCGQKLPNINKPSSESFKNELKQKEEELNDVKASIEYNKNINIKNYNNDAKSLEILLTDTEKHGKELNLNINSYETQLSTIDSELETINRNIAKAEAEIQNYNTNKSNIETEIKNLKDKLADISDKILYNLNVKDNIQKHIDIIKKFETIITRDFRGILLEDVISYINSKCSEYANDVFKHNNLYLKLDKNNLNIYYNDKLYETLSGGEKQKIDIIIQLSLRAMLCKFMNFSSNIFVVDEGFDNLDSTGVDEVINLITNKLNDIQDIFIISHHQDLNIPFDYIINVVKNDNGISSLI